MADFDKELSAIQDVSLRLTIDGKWKRRELLPSSFIHSNACPCLEAFAEDDCEDEDHDEGTQARCFLAHDDDRSRDV